MSITVTATGVKVGTGKVANTTEKVALASAGKVRLAASERIAA